MGSQTRGHVGGLLWQRTQCQIQVLCDGVVGSLMCKFTKMRVDDEDNAHGDLQSVSIKECLVVGDDVGVVDRCQQSDFVHRILTFYLTHCTHIHLLQGRCVMHNDMESTGQFSACEESVRW